jgi:adenine deaminase
MVKYGMTPLAAIQAGIMNGAKLLGWENQIGALKAGYYADIIAVPGDPLKDITALEKVAFVIKGGVVFKKYKVAYKNNRYKNNLWGRCKLPCYDYPTRILNGSHKATGGRSQPRVEKVCCPLFGQTAVHQAAASASQIQSVVFSWDPISSARLADILKS